MTDNDKKEFSSTYTLDYKMYKEFSKGFLATIKASIIILLIVLIVSILYIIEGEYKYVIWFGILYIILILINLIKGNGKIQYKRAKSLNNNEDIEATIKIGKDKIVSTSKKGDISSYEFDQIIGLIETKNLLILKLKYNMGIMIDKNNIEGGSKEELVEYIFSVCNNIKRKKVIKSKKWSLVRNIISVLILIVFILSIILLILKNHKIDEYMELLQQNGYYIEMEESLYNGHNVKKLTISKEDEHTWSYLHEFGTDKDAERNIKYWANLETNDNLKEEYIVENDKDYKKYIIENEMGYVVLIQKDNYVFYGIGDTRYKEELDNVVSLIEQEMK